MEKKLFVILIGLLLGAILISCNLSNLLNEQKGVQSSSIPLDKAIVGQWKLQSCEYKTSSGETGQDNSNSNIEFRESGQFLIMQRPLKNQNGFWYCGTWSYDGDRIVLGSTIAPCNCEEVKRAFFDDTIRKTGDRQMAQEIASGMCEPGAVAEYLWESTDFSVSGDTLNLVATPGSSIRQASGWEELRMVFKKVAEEPPKNDNPDKLIATKKMTATFIGFQQGDYLYAVVKSENGQEMAFMGGYSGESCFLANNKNETFTVIYDEMEIFLPEAGSYIPENIIKSIQTTSGKIWQKGKSDGNDCSQLIESHLIAQ